MIKLELEDISVWYATIEGSESRRAAEEATLSKMLHEAFGPNTIRESLPSGAPILIRDDKEVPGSFTVSHSRNLAAMAYCADKDIGIDVETYRSQLERVASRVLSEDELAVYTERDGVLRAWTMKEALYKAAGITGLDFRRDILLPVDGENVAKAGGRLFKIVYSDYLPDTDNFMTLVIAR